MPLMSFRYATPQSITLPSGLTSWMSSPSRKRTGFSVSRWSIRKVLGSFNARTIHLHTKIKETHVYIARVKDEHQSWVKNVHWGTNLPVGINTGLWSIVFCITSQQLHHHFCCCLTVKWVKPLLRTLAWTLLNWRRTQHNSDLRSSRSVAYYLTLFLKWNTAQSYFCFKKEHQKDDFIHQTWNVFTFFCSRPMLHTPASRECASSLCSGSSR